MRIKASTHFYLQSEFKTHFEEIELKERNSVRYDSEKEGKFAWASFFWRRGRCGHEVGAVASGVQRAAALTTPGARVGPLLGHM
jgi:hypothetical protein